MWLKAQISLLFSVLTYTGCLLYNIENDTENVTVNDFVNRTVTSLSAEILHMEVAIEGVL
jgi:hypothetical protein